MKKYIVCIIVLFICKIGNSQITNGTPRSSFAKLNKNIPTIEMPSFDLKKIQEEDAINDLNRTKAFRFGYEFEVDFGLKNSGVWEELPNGDQIWRINIKSEGAHTLNFIFDSFELAEGAEVYLYNDDRSFILGAYTSKMNNENKSLGTWIADGDKITIEYYVPVNVKGLGNFHIGSVVHGYRSVSNFEAQQKRLNDSGPCNLDVNCPVGADFDPLKDKLKKAVALILNNGSDWCSGTLINNTSNNGAPYLLTANHCAGNEANWSFRFNWISSNTVCATNDNSVDNGSDNFYQTTSGARVLARNSQSDFELVEVLGGLDDTWDLEWAGWDRTGQTPSFVVGIHHPSGDIMKVCRQNIGPTISDNFRVSGISEPIDTWRVSNWDLGVTERGSSGSAIFDPNGRILGGLSGGDAACSGTNDNGGFDVYGRFEVSWDFGTTDATRLSNWLDPGNKGCLILNMLSEENAGMNVCEEEVVIIEEDKPVRLYPNPTEDELFVTNVENEVTKYGVFNVFGRKILEGLLNTDKLDLSALSSGVYFVQIENSKLGEDFIKKIIVK